MPEIDRSQLVDILSVMVTKRQSGSLLVSSDNRAATIALQKGEIISVSYGPKRGREAVVMLSEVSLCRHSVSTMVLARPMPDLPPTAEVLRLLEVGPAAAAAAPPQAAPMSKSPAEVVTAAAPESEEPAKLQAGLDHLAAILPQFLGPLGPLVLEDLLEDMGEINTEGRFRVLVQKLSLELMPTDIEAFLKKAGVRKAG